jgi:ubiquinone/menaquinone biosynthesis C-methylase UbiE
MVAQKKAHHRFPEKMAFLLNNPIRRRLSPPEKLIAKLDVGAGDTVIDFGCGPGFVTIPLARIASKAIGVDVSQEMLERTNRYAKSKGLSLDLVQSDGTKLELPDTSVDLILLNHVFHEVGDQRAALQEFKRVLKRSGRVAIVEKTRGGRVLGSLGPPVIDEKELTRELRESGFSSVDVVPFGKNSIIIGQVTPQ